MGVGAYVYLPLSSLQPLAPTAAVSSILSTYPSCPTNCVHRFPLSLSPFFFFLSSIYIAVSLSLFVHHHFVSPFFFVSILRGESRETRPPPPAFLPSFVRISMHQTYVSNEECMRTCKRCRLHLVLATSRRSVHALITSPHASDAYYATADCGLCHDLDQTICSGRACALVKSRTGQNTDFVFPTIRTDFSFFFLYIYINSPKEKLCHKLHPCGRFGKTKWKNKIVFITGIVKKKKKPPTSATANEKIKVATVVLHTWSLSWSFPPFTIYPALYNSRSSFSFEKLCD